MPRIFSPYDCHKESAISKIGAVLVPFLPILCDTVPSCVSIQLVCSAVILLYLYSIFIVFICVNPWDGIRSVS